MQRRGQHTMMHRHDHLDQAGRARRRLGVPDVRLHRTEPDRTVGALLPVGGDQCLGLDGVAERGAGAVRLDGVDLAGGESGVRECLADDLALGAAARRGQAVGRAVLVDGRTAQDGEDRVVVGPCVGEAFQDEDTGALGERRTVRGGGERLDRAVGRESALPAERGEHAGAAHDGDPARQREGALAAPQGLDGEVEADQRTRAGGVDGQRGALQTERVRDPAGDHTGGVAAEQVSVQAVRRLVQAHRVLLRLGGDEDAGPAGAQGPRVDPGPLHGLPHGLQHEALLRVHREGFTGADGEEVRVELGRTGQESAVPGVGGAGGRGVVVEEPVEVPAPVGGELVADVGAVGDQPPQVLGGRHVAGVAAADADDGDRVVGGDARCDDRVGQIGQAQGLGAQMCGERGR
ncbi:hypothetical protein EES39_19765 [Streptomyces sp. ADI92-24]|nr:hypothetical protein EES39_19765 [Streptomyces sp. ADI92-24]